MTGMTDDVERVARALYAAEGHPDGQWLFEQCTSGYQECMRRKAKAVIAAMPQLSTRAEVVEECGGAMTNQEIAAEIVRHRLAVFLQPRSGGLDELRTGLVEDIAKALDAEREACAQIVREHKSRGDTEYAAGVDTVCNLILDAIRSRAPSVEPECGHTMRGTCPTC